VDAVENSAAFNDANLAQYQAVVFLLTTGDVLDNAQQAAFERYIRRGNGFVGVHAASDTEYDWPWYGGLVGAYFHSHPDIQTATVRLEDRTHPSTAGLPQDWVRVDEWYNFRENPRHKVRVLARLDEATYTGGTMGDHPIAWYQNYEGGRAWYTGGGHTEASYADPLFLNHVLGGIKYAAGRIPGQP
jgi:type 1 glutamine amidotransferase